MTTSNRLLGAALAAGVLAGVPAVAGASPSTAAATVALHTDRADAALARAAALFRGGDDAQALRAVAGARVNMGRAVSAAARLLREAETPAERVAAARALRALATQQDDNVPALLAMLPSAGPRADVRLARVALADVNGRERAIAKLNGLLAGGLPAAARTGVTRAIAALSTERAPEVTRAAAALADDDTPAAAAQRLSQLVDRSLRGQARAAATITVLIGRLPEAARPGLERALRAIAGEQAASAARLAGLSDRMPERVRAFVARIVAQARDDARQLRGQINPPVPVSPGPPAGTPGAPEDAPVPTDPGPPSGTPTP